MKPSDIFMLLAGPWSAYQLFTQELSGLLFVCAATGVTMFPVWLTVRIFLWRAEKEMVKGRNS